MHETNWSTCVGMDVTVDEAADKLQTTITSCFRKAFPKKLIHFSNFDKPLMTPNIKTILNQQDKAYLDNKGLKYFHLREDVITTIKKNSKAMSINVILTISREFRRL
jgi:hypothetical protein